MIYKNSTLIRSIIAASFLLNTIACSNSGGNHWGEVTNETITNKEREETYKGNNENAKRQKDDELATLVRQKAMQDNIKKGEVK